jgi:hypothetical protein
MLGHELRHRAARPRAGEVDRRAAVLDARPARQLAHEPADHLLGQIHQVGIGGVRLVELEHRELRVVPRRQTLVAEHARQLEDALVAAHDEPLQVQLGCDPEIELGVEGVVVRDERARRGRRRAAA